MVKINPLANVSLTSDTTSLNANFSEVTTAFNNTLSRDGSSPNNMLVDLDMDSQRIINLPEATASTEPARYSQLNINDLTDTDLTGITDGQFLVYQASTGKFVPSDVFLVSGGGGGAVDSVNGKIGTVVLTTTDISEGTNLYYTQAKFDAAFTAKSTTDLNEGTNLYYTTARFDTDFATKTTAELSELTNLYYTQGRFDAAFAAKSTTNLSEGTNLYYTQGRFDTAFTAKSTTDLIEGTNLYYTQAKFDTAFTGKSTTNLSEGTNLYYTDERAQDAVGLMVGSTITYTDATPLLDVATNGITNTHIDNTVSYTVGGLTVNGTTNALSTIDKNAVADNALTIFQTNGSTRAEIGLKGNDDLTVIVSPNGTDFIQAVFIDKDSANVGLGTVLPGDKLHVKTGMITAEAGVGSTNAPNTAAGLKVFADSATRYAAIHPYRGLFSSRVGMSFFVSAGGAPAEAGRFEFGFVVGAPTGGDKGTGNINAQGVYDDNVLLTDLVIDYFVDGSWDEKLYSKHPLSNEINRQWFDVDWYADYWQQHRHLPGMISWDNEKHRPSTGEVITRLTAVVETQAVLIESLNRRLKELEK